MHVHCFVHTHVRAVDGTFSNAALQGKIQIKEQLPKYLGGGVQLGETRGEGGRSKGVW